MRRLWDGKRFFSLYEHVDGRQLQELLEAGAQVNLQLERDVGLGNFVPHLAAMVRKNHEETILNNIIGIA